MSDLAVNLRKQRDVVVDAGTDKGIDLPELRADATLLQQAGVEVWLKHRLAVRQQKGGRAGWRLKI